MVGFVEARKNVSTVFVLALRPNLIRAIANVFIGRQEIKTSARCCEVTDANGSAGDMRVDGNAKNVAVVDRIDGDELFVTVFADFDGVKIEGDGIESNFRRSSIDAYDVEHCFADDRFFGHFQRYIERYVLDAKRTRSFVLASDPSERERSASCGRLRIGRLRRSTGTTIVMAILETHCAASLT